jgi:hypothetical protein
MPEGIINVARVGNESLSLLIYTALVYACLRMLDDGATIKSALAIGLLLGCGLLTKAYFLTAIPAVCVVFALTTARRSAGLLALALSVATSMSFWWYRFIYRTTGDLTGQIQSVALRDVPLLERLRTAFHLNWLQAIDTALFSHIWFGGWSFLQVRAWMYHLFYLLLAAAFAGLLAIAFRTVPNRRGLVTLTTFELCLCASLGYQVVLSQIQYHQPMTCGWYLYCLVFAEACLICTGWLVLSVWILPAVTALFAALDIYGLNFLLIPYYTGFIAHGANGHLSAFHIGDASIPNISSRILTLHPFLGASVLVEALWVLNLAATIGCATVAFFVVSHYRKPSI